MAQCFGSRHYLHHDWSDEAFHGTICESNPSIVKSGDSTDGIQACIEYQLFPSGQRYVFTVQTLRLPCRSIHFDECLRSHLFIF